MPLGEFFEDFPSFLFLSKSASLFLPGVLDPSPLLSLCRKNPPQGFPGVRFLVA